MSRPSRPDRRRGPELRPFDRKLVLLSLVAIIACGAVGWAAGVLVARISAATESIIADHTGRRPHRPPLPASPFVQR